MEGKYKVAGFKASAWRAGLRKGNDSRNDLALFVCENEANTAGVFTKNLVKAAPVIVSQQIIKKGKARAIIVNAGYANAMTGEQGIKSARTVTEAVAKELEIPPHTVIPASTGVIGVNLPLAKIVRAIPALVENLREDGFSEASKAIMTTDKVPKVVVEKFSLGTKRATLVGIAKGAGMIAPDMATMLAFLFTDASVSSQVLKKTLKESVEESFNRVRVDGDTSTNDMAVVMAGGALRNSMLTESSPQISAFQSALSEACFALAEMMARDGEGATKIMDLRVIGAKTKADAIKVGKTISDSPLVKTALHGGDPNWGRIAAAVGRSGVKIDPNKLIITIGKVECVRDGMPSPKFNEKRAAMAMRKPTVIVTVDLQMGKESARFLASDLTAEYIHINAHYRT